MQVALACVHNAGSSLEEARHPLGVLPLTVSVDGSDAILALRVDVKPTTAHWIIEAESTWLTADSGVFEVPIVKAAEDVNGRPSTRVVSCTPLLLVCTPGMVLYGDTFELYICAFYLCASISDGSVLIEVVPHDFELFLSCVCSRR